MVTEPKVGQVWEFKKHGETRQLRVRAVKRAIGGLTMVHYNYRPRTACYAMTIRDFKAWACRMGARLSTGSETP